eukprot:gb/GECG01003278.1/.p1 GENE.gb/GECG01003278.1/~~gb/GECG01003278.1/.p1  ORF type:complete len:846 (+),score=41.12 gb/GECG01003278.1/:1-2538(+)
MPAKQCDRYDITVGLHVNASVYRNCDDVPADGVYFIAPFWGERTSGFWTRCRNGFIEITQQIAKEFLNATLTSKGHIKESGFLVGNAPFSVDGTSGYDHGAHYSHYDIPIPFSYTQFWLDGFHIRATSFLANSSEAYQTSDIRRRSDAFYTTWQEMGLSGDGDFAFGSPAEEGPTTSYARYQKIQSHGGIHKFAGNGIIFDVKESNVFRLHWGEEGSENEGWAWWNGSIWVRYRRPSSRIYSRCELVPDDGIYLINPFGDSLSEAFQTRCRSGFMEITTAIAKHFLNATLSTKLQIKDSGFIDDVKPFTVDGECGHIAQYEIPVPFGYTRFFTEHFNIRSTSYISGWLNNHTSEIKRHWGRYYDHWSQIVGSSSGDFAFGSGDEQGPTTSYAHYQHLESHGGIHRFEGDGVIFNVTKSSLLRIEWSENGSEHEGWAWWQGSIWVRDDSIDTVVYRHCGEVPRDGFFLIDPFPSIHDSEDSVHLVDPFGIGAGNAFWTKCRNGFTEITQRIARFFLNATLTWDGGGVIRSGFVDDVRPFTVDGNGDHYAHYDIPIPFGYTEFYLDDFHIRATSYKLSATHHSLLAKNAGHYTQWHEKKFYAPGCCSGDFAFGSPKENGPTTSYARYQRAGSNGGVFQFAGNGIVYTVSQSAMFRMHWGEGGAQSEGWAWWNGSLWVRNKIDNKPSNLRKNPNIKVRAGQTTTSTLGVSTCCVSLQVDPCPRHKISSHTQLRCSDCGPGKIPNTVRNACIPCRPQHVANQTDRQCRPCPSGQVPNESQNVCHSCEGGRAPNHNLTACVKCEPGTYSRPGFQKCRPCGPYGIQPFKGQTECRSLNGQIPRRSVQRLQV